MSRTTLAVTVSLILVAASAQAQGFGIYEQGACAMARAGAAVAEPCPDGSAIYLNPAGTTGRKGLLISLGGTLVAGTGSFTDDPGHRTELDGSLAKVPHGYLQYGVSERLALGVGVYVPYGLGVKWPLEFGGRFVGYDSHLQTTYIQPTLAYAIGDRVSVGGGLTVAVGSVNLKRREDLANVPLGIVPGLTFGALLPEGTDFATTALAAAHATGVGANLGLIVKPHDRVRVGARYLSKIGLSYTGTAKFTPVTASYRVTKPNPLGLPVGTPLDPFVAQVVGSLQDQDVSTAIDMPAQFTTGVSVHANPHLTMLADYQWVGWSAFRTINLDFAQPLPPDETIIQNYRNTSAVRLGVTYETARAIRLSAGYFYNQAAAPDENVTPLLPEARRNHVTAGVGWNMGSRFHLDTAYQFVRHADRRGRIVNPPPGALPTVALNSGVYRERANLLGITLTYGR